MKKEYYKQISISDLKVNDIIYMDYCYSKEKFCVKAVFENDGILVRSVDFLGIGSYQLFVSIKEARKIHYLGRKKLLLWNI